MGNVLTWGILALFLICGIVIGINYLTRRYYQIDVFGSEEKILRGDPTILAWFQAWLRILISGRWRLRWRSQLKDKSAEQVPQVINQGSIHQADAREADSVPKPGLNKHSRGLSIVLLILSLMLYLIIRFVDLAKFPIYFFTDEAVHMILAEQLVQNHFIRDGKFLPIFFPLGSSFGLNSISVYLNIIPYLLFGKSIVATRAVTVIISLGGALAVAAILKEFFHSRYWWVSVLLLSLTPAWFYHTRTAFEYVLGAAFYAVFLYFYLSYRLKDPKFLYLAILFGALVFYSHGLGQPLMAVTSLLLLIIDFRYHWQNRKTFFIGLGMVFILLLPYYRFARENPTLFEEQIRTRGSYWLDPALMLTGKIIKFTKEYLTAFSPLFWYLPENGRDLARHITKGFGHLPYIGLPFLLYGFWVAIRQIRNPASRVALVALLASPFGAALAQVTILRVIWFIIPATILTGLGLSSLLEKLKINQVAVALTVFAILGILNVYLFRESLTNGPLWYRDYSLYGMQYGANQLFGEAIPEMMAQDPNSHYIVSPIWANGTDMFPGFFMTPDQQKRVRLDGIQAFLYEPLPVDDNLILVITGPEYDQAVSSPKFKDIRVLRVIPYPDGTPGFYFVKLAYADNAGEIFETEKLARSQPLEGEVLIDGQPAKIVYSRTDMGDPTAIFDGDINTLMRGLEANPFVIDITFPELIRSKSLTADFASMDFRIKAEVFEDPTGEPVIYESEYRGLPGNPHIELAFDRGPASIRRVRLEIFSLTGEQPPHIHVRELSFQP